MTRPAPTADTCTIVTEFFGIMLDPCGLDATHTSTGNCDNGHTRTRHICTSHAEAFAALPDRVVCEQCAQAGTDTPMAVTIRKSGEVPA